MENDFNENDVSENLPSDNSQNASNNSQNKKSKSKSKKKFNIFKPFSSLFEKTKADEEKKNKSITFGLISILFSCLCIGLCYPCVWLGVKGVVFAFTHNLGVFTYFLGLGNLLIAAFSLGVMVLPYYFWFHSVWLVWMQFVLNKKAIRWIALLVWLICFFGIFLLSLESFLVVTGLGHLFS